MMLGIRSVLVVTVLSVSFKLIWGSTELVDVNDFDFFWSPELKHIRDSCDSPEGLGSFHTLLQYAMEDSEDCQIVMDRWRFLHNHQLIKSPSRFRSSCGHIAMSAALCWDTILMFMETCHKSYRELDHDRVHLFPNFLGALCIYNTTGLFNNLRVPPPDCVERHAREFKQSAKTLNTTDDGSNPELYARAENCWNVKASFVCSYMARKTPHNLIHVYLIADYHMDKIFRCNDLSDIYTNLKGFEKAIRGESLLET